MASSSNFMWNSAFFTVMFAWQSNTDIILSYTTSIFVRSEIYFHECSFVGPSMYLCWAVGPLVGIFLLSFRKHEWDSQIPISWNKGYVKTGRHVLYILLRQYKYLSGWLQLYHFIVPSLPNVNVHCQLVKMSFCYIIMQAIQPTLPHFQSASSYVSTVADILYGRKRYVMIVCKFAGISITILGASISSQGLHIQISP